MSLVVVVNDPARKWDALTIGPFENEHAARTEAQRHRNRPGVRAMVRHLWDREDVLRELEAGYES